MKTKSTSLLRLPSGSASLFLQAARHQQRLVQALNELYDSWAYLPVHTPLVDFSRSYEGLVPEKDLKRVYHLVDRDGEILMLRWDLTLFLVKQVGSLLSEAPLPLRLCYADSILRHQDSEDISHNEFFQTGAELIGRAGPDGDLEVLLLLHQALTTLNLPATIHLGNRRLFNLAFGDQDTPLSRELIRAIAGRDFTRAAEIAVGISVFDLAQTQAIIAIFSLIGTAAEISTKIDQVAAHLPASVLAEAQTTIAFAESATSLAPSIDIHLDFSELGGQSYYSGLVFQAYADGVSSAIASGGRYDRLLERLGNPAPAAGFSIMLSKIAAISHLQGESISPIVDLGKSEDPPKSFAGRYSQAATLRAAGNRVAL